MSRFNLELAVFLVRVVHVAVVCAVVFAAYLVAAWVFS